MAKQSGLGDNLYVSGYNLSGDIGSLNRIGGGPEALPVTGIDKYAFERIGGRRDGAIEFSSWFNPAASQAHPVLSALPRVDTIVSYFRGTAIGSPAANLVAKQIEYDGTRADDGAFNFKVSALANGYGLEWGTQLTAGRRTDTGATNGASIDTLASVSLGAQAYLHVFSLTGTDATITIQDSANDIAFTDVTGLSFTQVTSAPTAQRIATGPTAAIRRYIRAVTTTSAGFTSLGFAVVVVKNATAVSF